MGHYLLFILLWLRLNTIWLWLVVAFMRRLEGSNACGLPALRLITPWDSWVRYHANAKVGRQCKEQYVSLMESSVRVCMYVFVCLCVFLYTRSVQEWARASTLSTTLVPLLSNGYMVECERGFASMC